MFLLFQYHYTVHKHKAKKTGLLSEKTAAESQFYSAKIIE